MVTSVLRPGFGGRPAPRVLTARRIIGSMAAPESAESHLQRGREAFERHEWKAAAASFRASDAMAPLGAEDLERLAWAAELSDDVEGFLKGMERIYEVRLAGGGRRPAARAAFGSGFARPQGARPGARTPGSRARATLGGRASRRMRRARVPAVADGVSSPHERAARSRARRGRSRCGHRGSLRRPSAVGVCAQPARTGAGSPRANRSRDGAAGREHAGRHRRPASRQFSPGSSIAASSRAASACSPSSARANGPPRFRPGARPSPWRSRSRAPVSSIAPSSCRLAARGRSVRGGTQRLCARPAQAIRTPARTRTARSGRSTACAAISTKPSNLSKRPAPTGESRSRASRCCGSPKGAVKRRPRRFAASSPRPLIH
jgi:hypothetical protein